jgi:hypothetical protein
MSQPVPGARSHRARTAAVLVVLALALAGCSGDDDGDVATDESAATDGDASSDGGGGGGGDEASGEVDPRALDDPCTIFPSSTIEDVLGEPVEFPSPNLQTYEIGCDWSASSGPYMSYRLETERPGQEAYDGVMQYLEVSEGVEELDLGDQAVIKVVEGETGENATLDAVINDWYVNLTVADTDDPRAGAVELAEYLERVLVPFTAMEGGSTDGEEGASDDGDAVPGTLVDFEVTIEEPAEMAGTTTLDSLDMVGLAGFANCSQPGSAIFVLAFNAPPATDPPTPVGVFNLTVEEGIDVGETAPVVIGVGLGQSDVATTTNYEGTMTVDADGTGGTFEAEGGPKGTWSCEWTE